VKKIFSVVSLVFIIVLMGCSQSLGVLQTTYPGVDSHVLSQAFGGSQYSGRLVTSRTEFNRIQRLIPNINRRHRDALVSRNVGLVIVAFTLPDSAAKVGEVTILSNSNQELNVTIFITGQLGGFDAVQRGIAVIAVNLISSNNDYIYYLITSTGEHQSVDSRLGIRNIINIESRLQEI